MKTFEQNLKYSEVMFLSEGENPQEKIVVVSNLALNVYLQYYLYYYCDDLKVFFQQPEQFLNERCVCERMFLLLEISDLAPYLYYHLYEMEQSELENETKKLTEYLEIIIKKAANECRTVIISEFEYCSSKWKSEGLLDINEILRTLNKFLRNRCIENTNVFVFPINEYINEYGRVSFYHSMRKYVLSSHYSNFAYNCIAYHLLEQIKNVTAKSKKCLVLDCDNVLWKGIIGEDGIEGIKLSNYFIGKAYLDFQYEIIKLYYSGIIICLCSKNQLDDVKNIIDNHPDMLLRDKYIAAYKVNYHNKADNLRELEKELNISGEDMVFVDDSIYEIELVKRELPKIGTILLDADRPDLYAKILRDSGFFYKKSISETDKIRNEDYKRRKQRQIKIKESANLEEYHRTLQTKIQIEKMSEYTLTRVLEISVRTNQFNLSNKRYDEQYLKALMTDDKKDIFVMRIEDIFGDMGIVAAAEVLYRDDTIVICAMFLSCRVFERKFEIRLLDYIRNVALSRGINKIQGVYKTTLKNQKFARFYEENNVEIFPDEPEM